jgi:hypothetical protein
VGKHPRCVDDWVTYDWEADLPSRLATGLAFWIWYLPAELIRHRHRRRTRPVVDEASVPD